MRARTTIAYSLDRGMYRVGGWFLASNTPVEVMLAGRWVPGVVRQSAIDPTRWTVQVPVGRPDGNFSASVLLTTGLRVRPPRERAAEAVLER